MKDQIWANLRDCFPNNPIRLTYLTCLVPAILAVAGCLQQSSLSPNEAVAAAVEPATPELASTHAEPSAESDFDDALAEADQQSISTARAKKVSTEIEVPANLKPSPATAEIIKLANSGVEESVMLTFTTNSLGTFNLRAEEIIYLKDIGIPSGVITAMIQRDHLLQGTSANLTIAAGDSQPTIETPPAPVYAPDAAETTAPISETAPLPAYASDNYAMPVESEPSVTDYSDYNDALAPYGSWVDVEGYGRCWQPTVVVVNHGWRPYLNCGRWVYTDCGWYWMSDYSWGWAPFHYGRWFQHASLGWCWRPDRVWGPSWVCWRQNGDYCGWAPLPPCARFAGGGLTFRGHPARHNFSFGLAADHFRFVHTGHFLARDVARHVLPRDHSARIFDHTIASTGIISHNHRVSNTGIPREHVASAIHANIVPVTLHNVTPTAGAGVRERFERNGRTLAVFRPDARQRTPARTSTATRRTDVPANNSVAGIQNHTRFTRGQPQTTPVASSPTAPASRTETPVRTGQPLILRGSEHPRQTALAPASTPQNTRRTVPLNTVVAAGQHRDSRIATTQPDTRPPRNSHNRPSPAYNRDFSHSSPPLVRQDETRSNFQQPQTPDQSTWWAQPQQPRTSNQEQFQHNRETPARAAGNWNATVESPRHNPTPVHVPEHTRSAPAETRQSHHAPVESRPSHTVPVESHPSRSAPVESHQTHSAPVESRSHSAPAPTPSSPSSSSRDSSSHSSGRGR